MINHDLVYKILGERLRDARLHRGLDQSDLARAISHLRTSITNIEGGRQRAPLHVLFELCHYLGIELASIIPWDEEINEETSVAVQAGSVVQELPPLAADVLKEILLNNGTSCHL